MQKFSCKLYFFNLWYNYMHLTHVIYFIIIIAKPYNHIEFRLWRTPKKSPNTNKRVSHYTCYIQPRTKGRQKIISAARMCEISQQKRICLADVVGRRWSTSWTSLISLPTPPPTLQADRCCSLRCPLAVSDCVPPITSGKWPLVCLLCLCFCLPVFSTKAAPEKKI